MKVLASNAILADYLHRREDGKLDVLGVVGAVVAKTFPASLGQMWLYWRVALDEQVIGESSTMSVHLRYPSGELLLLATAEAKSTAAGFGTTELLMPMPPVPIPAVGVYRLELSVADQMQSSLVLEARAP